MDNHGYTVLFYLIIIALCSTLLNFVRLVVSLILK